MPATSDGTTMELETDNTKELRDRARKLMIRADLAERAEKQRQERRYSRRSAAGRLVDWLSRWMLRSVSQHGRGRGR